MVLDYSKRVNNRMQYVFIIFNFLIDTHLKTFLCINNHLLFDIGFNNSTVLYTG